MKERRAGTQKVHPQLFMACLSSSLLVTGPVFAQSGEATSNEFRASVSGSSVTPDGSEIVVTAQRRDERAQDVPIAITAFSSERLQQQNITTAQDLQGTAPSLLVGPNGQGSRDTQSFTIRGQGATFQASPGVVVYLNEVPLPAAVSLSQQGGPGNFGDLENVQVLAGPQGTLFGRNTTGGAVLLVPKKPTNDFSGWVQGKYGNFDSKEIEGAVNAPIISDKLLVRLVGAYHDRDGYTRDVVWNKDRDNVHWYSGRLGVTWRPTDNIENYLMAYGSYSKNNGSGLIANSFNVAGLSSVGFCHNPSQTPQSPISVPCGLYEGVAAQTRALGPRATAHGIDDFQKTKTWGITDTLDIDLSDELTLRNIVSFQKFKSFYRYDGDATILQQNDQGPSKLPETGQAAFPGGRPIAYYNSSQIHLPRDSYKFFTEELQLQGTFLDNHLTVTAGGFYSNQTPAGPQGNSTINYCPAALTGIPLSASFNPDGTLSTRPLCIPSVSYGYVSTRSTALYFQSSLDLGAVEPSLEGLRLTGGFRYTWDRISGRTTSYTPTAYPLATSYICQSTSELVSDPSQCGFSANLKSKAPSWLVGIDYRPINDVLLYAKVNRGYKSGGLNSFAVFPETRVFEPEYVTSYEGGFKSDFRIGGIPWRLNATYFFLDYDNIQIAAGDFNPVTTASGARIISAKAEVQGVELEASFKPWKPIEIGANFSYNDFKYTRFSTISNGSLEDCSGTFPPPGSPTDFRCLSGVIRPVIYSIHTAVEMPISETMGTIALFANYSHNGAFKATPIGLPASEPGSRMAPFGTLNISLDWKNIAHSGIDAGIFVTNAANKTYRISNSNVYQALLTQTSIYGEPRMYGLRLRYRFNEK